MTTTRISRSTWIGVALADAFPLLASIGGCAAQPASPEQLQAAERRLIAPFLTGAEVECEQLEVEMSFNFNAYVSQPALDPGAHARRREAGSNYIDTIWTNTLGQRDKAFVVTIGEPAEMTAQGLRRGPVTRFRVLNQLRVRVHQGGAPLLKAHASSLGGGAVAIREATAQRPRQVREFRIENGAAQLP
ncbi:MAG: hypothetical protein KDC98_00265 [Planctomycetes bacterium]|nr:hypothetical protein [Planctomycetota bacterium]